RWLFSVRFAAALLLLAIVLGCDRISGASPKPIAGASSLTPGWTIAADPLPKIGALGAPSVELAATAGPGFTFEPGGIESNGWLQFQVTIGAGGSPAGVAEEKFTPLFSVDGK